MSISPGVPISCSSSSSITELLGALCDSCLSGVSWKRRALGSVTREGVRRALRKRAYGALLSKLFQEGPSKGALGCGLVASTPPRNKVLMISFDLRVSGCREEAERLEALLGMLGEGSSSGLGELDSALELLVQLAGSVAPPPASFSRDYMRRERPVLRRPPLGGYQSEELQQLEARAWALICREEWSALGALHGTLGLMDASPGSGLLVLGQGSEVEERFQKETRLSLFGALQHTRTSDLDIKLDLPPVPSNIEVTGLTIRVPPSVDQSEDEGFQSASNLTPDSQSEPSPCPELDVWEALRNFRPGRRRCWESVGCPPGRKEDPYLTEAGREAFDRLYRLWEGEMRLVSTATVSPPPPIPLHSQTQLVGHLLNVLIGVESATFPLNQACVQFDVRPGVCISGASPESVSRLLGELAQYGTHYLRLSQFSLQSPLNRGLVFQAFTGGLRRYLQYYRACVLCTPPSLSLLTIGFLFRKLGRQLRYLFELCCVDGATGVSKPTFPVGVKLLSYLYNEAQSNCSNENYPVLLSLLKSSCEPYTRFVSDWVYSGVFRDVYQEFMIQVNEDFLSFRDKHFWVQGYTLISQDVEECVPVFLRHIANDVYVCGKTINLLKICCPQHYICWSELPVPRIAVTFSLQEVEEIERDCAVYRGHMERIAKHSALSREEQALRTELARQELINQVRESTAKTLESIQGRQVSQRLAAEAEKRERFEELKRHLEAEQEWHSAAKRREQDDDFGFARELRDREKRLQALEEQLERKARKELIAQYSCLTEEAARRERRALWRVQRLQLDNARTQFLKEDQQLTEALLERYPLGQGKVPLNVLPFSAATYNPPQGPQAAENCLSEEEERTRESVDTESSPRFFSSAATPILSGDLDIQDFLPKTPQLPDNSQVDRALQDIGYDLPEASLPTQNQDYDFSAPYSPLTEGSARPRRVAATQPGLHGASLEVQELHGQPPDSDIPPNQHQSERPQQSAVVQGLSPEDSVRQTTSEQGAEQKDPTADTMRAVELSNQKAATQTQVEDPETISPVSAMETTPLPGTTHGHSSDSTLAVGCVVPGTEPVASPLPGSQYGHSSDSTLGVGCVVLAAEPVTSPISGSAHGHVSDSTLGMGCVVTRVWGPASSLPGVASDNASWTLEETAAVRQNLLAVVEEGSMSQECQGPKEGNPGEEQQLLETWSLGLGIFPGEGAELDYLLSLAAQYQVEQYQDDYSLLTSAPDSQLLQQVTRGPSGLPAEWSLRRATDATAVQLSEMVSLPVLMKHSVTTPLITHVSLVNKAAVDYFFVELGLERHFQALRHFLLMEDGEFAQSLSDLLFEKLGSGQTPGELLTPLVLNSILNKALQYSLHGHGELAAKFTFALRFVPETFHPHAPDVLHCLELRYKVDWPLNVIITDTCMNKYNRLFSFLLQLKHMVWTLRDVWFHLKRAALVKGAGRSAQFRQLQLYRHEMQHFVKVIQGYIANQILQVSWSEFTQKLGQASDLDAIHRTHADYLNRAICRGLLTEKAASVMNIIHTIFSLVLKFRAQLIAQPWSSQQGEAVHPSFVAMQQSYNTFKYYSHFLFKVVTKLVNKGYQPHLEDFLLRINFNNYYRDS